MTDVDRAGDGVGAVLRAWRATNRRSQVDVAVALGMTQQHLSQIEGGKRPLSIEQRRLIVRELGIAPEDLGLAAAIRPIAHRDAVPDVTASRLEWRHQRRWLNRHRSELARLAADLYPADVHVPRSPLIAAPAWTLPEPVDLASVDLALDEGPQTVEVDGSEPESQRVRPLRAPGVHFDRYTAAIRQLDPPSLFESRPSYRFLGGSPGGGSLSFGMAAYFDKLDISEAVGHELAAVCMGLGVSPPVPRLWPGSCRSAI